MILEITEHAAKIFHESVEGLEPKPYLRVGAKKVDVLDGLLL